MLNDCNVNDKIKTMSRDELIELQALIGELLAAPVAGNEPTPQTKAKKPRNDSAPYTEIKLINGHRYAYQRWWEGGKLQNKYIGKAA